MKIQLITQNIKPIALKSETNSNPILKNNPADSFERQSNVAFKGSVANVATSIADEVFKSKVLASIATKGEEGLEELCTDLNTLKRTADVVAEFLDIHVYGAFNILMRKIILTEEDVAVEALVNHHHNADNAIDFWQKLTQKDGKADKLIKGLNEEAADNLTRSINNYINFAETTVIVPKHMRQSSSVEDILRTSYRYLLVKL
jgi:hypothetical protein